MKNLIILIGFVITILSCTNQPVDKNKGIKAFKIKKVWTTDSILKVPESVLYDIKRDVIYVSNMNLKSTSDEENGFISKISTNGEIIDMYWIKDLKAPTGMAIFNGKLYVNDGGNTLVIIDIEKSEIIDRVFFENGKFLNDVSIDSSGVVYISDSKANVIYTWKDGKKEIWVDQGIQASNGLLCESDRILVAASDFISIDYLSKNLSIINDSINGGDGIAEVGCGYYLVSEWPGEVFLIGPDSSITSLLNTREAKINSADIDYIKNDSLLLVPTFYKNSIDAYKLIEE